jgi:hypothetical protein
MVAAIDRSHEGDRMPPEPTYMIPWTYDGYRALWLYQAGDVSDDAFEAFSRAVGDASLNAETVDDLTAAIEEMATSHSLVVRQYPGPSHSDPLRNTFRVGVFKEAPTQWPPTEDQAG